MSATGPGTLDKKRSSQHDIHLQSIHNSGPSNSLNIYTNARNDEPTASSSSSSFRRQPLAGRSAAVGNMNKYGYGHLRTSSPPASTYVEFAQSRSPEADDRDEPNPLVSPEAPRHFAYSTTLRRHTSDGTGLLLPVVGPGVGGSPLAGVESDGWSAEGTQRRAVAIWNYGGLVAQEIWKRAQVVLSSGDGADKESGQPVRSQVPTSTPSAEFAVCSVEDTISHFRTSSTTGLSASAIPSLRSVHGYNEFDVPSPEPLLLKFAKTIYESPLILLLFGSSIVSAVVGNIDDAVSITVAILIVLTVGFIQERKTSDALASLTNLIPHHAHLTRSGTQTRILANELVPGDLITFSTGDRIPADVRLVEAIHLEIDESSLTGETLPKRKGLDACVSPGTTGNEVAYPNEPSSNGLNGLGLDFGSNGRSGEVVPLAERSCIAYMGTLVRNGKGTGIVVATGTQTEFGVIFSMMQDVEEKRTPLQLSMDELAKKLSILSFAVIGVIVLIGVMQRRSWLDMFTIGVSLAVAAIPEGLPIVTTVTLALGVQRMSRRNAIVKKLHSVEALGSVSVVCSDKTGTLTKNEQTVTESYVIDDTVRIDPNNQHPIPQSKKISSAILKSLEVGCLCNNAFKTHDGGCAGQSTDVALLNVLDAFGAKDERENFTRLHEHPFNSEQKYMAISGVPNSSSGTSNPRETIYLKGAIEVVLERCRFYHVNETSTPALDPQTRTLVISKANEAAKRGLRVVALAYGVGSLAPREQLLGNGLSMSGINGVDSPSRSGSTANSRATSVSRPGTPLHLPSSIPGLPNNMIFVGFQAMLDPPRKGVSDAVSLLQAGGVHVVMITGDAEQTAISIAKELGLKVQHAPASTHSNAVHSSSMAETTSSCLTGVKIDGMSKAELRERVRGVSVFARTTPRHKMAIIEAFQANGEVVAMTGDGVNDAPALKMADIGVSMGKSGTDVAKEAADMILVDDNFSTILSAVEEGKSIFHNIQNFLSFQLSTAVAALLLITMSTFFGLSNPLNAMQILFINILMDGPPSQSLGVDPVDPVVMRKPPRNKEEPIISRRLIARVLFSASIIVLGTLFIYAYALTDARMSRRDQTMTFTCFVFLDLVSAFQNRGLGCGILQNKMLVGTISVSLLVQLTLVYVPLMQAIFQTEALAWSDMQTLLLLAVASMLLHEGRRRYERRLNAAGMYNIMVQELA